jgi:geranylgeranyl reductase family protein
MSLTDCDVLIVGGGPAGSSCARRLAGAGLDVLVLDKKAFPRDKPCAGWITTGVVDELGIDLDDYRRGRVLEPITGFCTGLIGGAEVETSYGRPVSYGIRRCEFDHYLLQRSGARLRLGEPLKTLERAGGCWLANGRIRARLVVGAGGHFCPVARALGARLGRGEAAVAAQEIEFEMDADQLRTCPVRPGLPYLYFCPDLKGYGWYYRKGSYLNVGLGREDDQGLSDHVAAFCARLQERGKIPRDLRVRFGGHAYLLYPRAPRRLVADRALLIGDAAGMAYSPSGEGIRPAVESGLLAADVILAAAGDYRAARLEPYRARLSARFGSKSARSASDLLPPGLKRFVAARLMASRWFARHVIVSRWFLHAHEPALAPGAGGPPRS